MREDVVIANVVQGVSIGDGQYLQGGKRVLLENC